MSNTMPLDERTKLMIATQAHDHQRQIATARGTVTELKTAKGALEEQLSRLERQLRHRMTTGLSTVVTVGAAGAAGYVDGYLDEKNWRLGPAKFTSVAGLAAVVTGLLVEDADAAELASAIGRGLAVGPVYMAGRAAGSKRGKAPVVAAVAEAAAPLAKK